MSTSTHPIPATVATMCYKGTGQTLALLPGATIVLGRSTANGIVSPHVSRKQVEIVTTASPIFEVTAIRRGGNISLLNNKALAKDMPTVLYDGDTITLLENKFPVTFDIKQPDAVIARRGSTKTTQDSEKVSRTQESLPPTSAPATSLPKSPADHIIPDTATSRAPLEKDKTEDNFWKRVKESATDADNKMDLDDPLSENTSESGEEDQPPVAGAAASRALSSAHSDLEMESDYFSDESSLVCIDYSDLDISGTAHDPQVVEVQSDSD
ncbi:hypothetical protein EMPS_05689 [Entomortierella parvispora]|uniref:FHA domain-containing protein n=1 Tax=Entomortierella parvispora TaxID=205924 RepID=A0A9P3LWJ3_9FUNG|nr:hypothetical protein EMPS_05689 [Entomortierella parvispora]